MEETITVSVIIPFFNNVRWLEEAVKSVFSQTYSDYEIIIINDGSPEEMSDFIRKYGNKITYKWQPNRGPGSARNHGIELASGKYIAFLDSDDLWQREKLKKQVKFMDETSAIWSHTNWVRFDENNPEKIIKYYTSGIEGNIFPLSLLSTNIATPSVMIRSEYLKQQPELRFSENMKFGQDYYLWILLSANSPLFLLPEILCNVRVRGGNTGLRARAHIQTRAQIWLNLKKNPLRLFYRKKWFVIIRGLYRLCLLEYNLILWLETRLNVTKILSELFSKVIFILPYISFRVLRFIVEIDTPKVKDRN